MKNKHILFAFCIFALFATSHSTYGEGKSDPRFYGDYYGTYTESYTIRVRVWFFGWRTIREERKTITCDIDARIEYDETASGQGMVYGGGEVTSGHGDIQFAFTGFVTDYGRIRGSGMASNVDRITANGVLSNGGGQLTLRAMGRTVVLHKDDRDNTPPTVTMVSPESGHRERYGTPLLLSARVSDVEDGTVDNNRIRWSSTIDGSLGTGRTRAVVLSPGTHSITVSATDSGGLTVARIRPLIIENHGPNTPQILQPLTGNRYTTLQDIVFRGYATDPEDGMLRDEALTWSSDVAGSIGHGNLVTRRLPIGNHRITLTATDRTGHPSTASVGIEVYRSTSETGSPPSIRIVSPGHLDVLSGASPIVFRAEANDLEDGMLSGGAIRWTDRYTGPDGEVTRDIGTGNVLTIDDLYTTPGTDVRHSIQATARNSAGNTAADSVTIYLIYGGLY